MEDRISKERNTELSDFRKEMRDGFLHARQETDDLRKGLRTSIQDVLDAMSSFATHVDENFALVKQDIATLKNDVSGLKSEMGAVKSSMVTKSYLDEKLASLYGDAVVMVRKEDTKVDNLTGILATKKVLSKAEAKEVVRMGPFPKA